MMKNNVILGFICLLPFFSIAAQSSSVVDTNGKYSTIQAMHAILKEHEDITAETLNNIKNKALRGVIVSKRGK